MISELNTNKSKKLIIGVSILFCTIILIIGVTTAFFTQSDTKELGNIVSTDINGTIGYTDNNDYMLGNLIPINVSDINKAYTREDNLKCKDDNGYNVCSIYNFTITNNANVTQSLIIDLYPVVNSFHNLRFNLYDITNNELLISNKELKYDDKTNISLDSLLLNNINNKSNTYELVFYIENKPEEDQTSLDAGKSFGATIKVNSITTGYNVVRDLGTGCWKADENDSTILSEFTGYTDKNENGYFDETDELKKECDEYFKKDNDNYYIVNVPSTYGGYTFKSLGNNLLNSLSEDYSYDEETGEEKGLKEYIYIKSIIIAEGIEEIKDGYETEEVVYGTFVGVGVALENQELSIFIPSSMTKIGDIAFAGSNLSSINIPNNVHTIGIGAFAGTKLTSITIPINVKTIGMNAFNDLKTLEKVIFETDENGNSSLESIGESAFSGCNLNYQDRNDPLIIPKSIGSIEEYAFGSDQYIGDPEKDANPNLHYIKYTGSNQDILNNTNGWYTSLVKELITTDE